jgi:hypothetical protein
MFKNEKPIVHASDIVVKLNQDRFYDVYFQDNQSPNLKIYAACLLSRKDALTYALKLFKHTGVFYMSVYNDFDNSVKSYKQHQYKKIESLIEREREIWFKEGEWIYE